MAPRLALVAVLPLAILALAGCSDDGSGDDDPTSSSTPTSSQPAVGRATAVEITSAPLAAPAGGKPVVCFAVSGTGKVAHVAIHWDNVTHAAEPNRTFSSYDLGASYPGNRSAPDPNGYQLQPTGTRYCTAATMPDKGALFVVAHVIDADGAPGDLSTERQIDVQPGDADLRIQHSAYDPPAITVRASEMVTVQNDDAVKHTATSAAAGFDTGDIEGGKTGSFAAPATPGTYEFGCAYHLSMKGTLNVIAR